MVIPADLPPQVAPLAWMLGSWSGWGMISSADEELPDRAVLHDVVAEVVGTQVRVTTTLRAATGRDGEDDFDLDPTLDAADGAALLIAGDVLREEVLYLDVLPGSGQLPAPGEFEPRELSGVGAQTSGLATVWAGVSLGPRVQLTSDVVARAPRAAHITHLDRMYGLVAGELMWTQEQTPSAEQPAGEEPAGQGPHAQAGAREPEALADVSGRLARTAYAEEGPR